MIGNPETYPAVSTQPSDTTLLLGDGTLEAMIRDGEARFPDECCGFFFGLDGDTRQVREVLVVPNSQEGDQRRRFEIAPRDYMRAERYAIEQGLDLLGIYHSHPDHPAIPSVHDLKQALPHFSYLILSIREGRYDHARSWRLDGQGLFAEEAVV
ncbi:MAG: M67 family metallopeptidase [Bacteroidia bacterium]